MKWLSATILVLVMVHCVRQIQKSPQQAVEWSVGLIALYLLLVSPSVYQWYLVWLLALVVLIPSWLTPAWLYWSWAVNLDYLATLPLFSDAIYWLYIVEYAPVFAWILAYWWVVRSGKLASEPHRPGGAPCYVKLSVIIPALSEEEACRLCWASYPGRRSTR